VEQYKPEPELARREYGTPSKHSEASGLAQLDLDFKDCPDKELSECWHWEFKRESKYVIETVFRWRGRFPDVKTFHAFFSSVRSLPAPPQDGHLYPLSPEWPRYPFLSIPYLERRRRLALLFQSDQETLAAKLNPRQPEIRPESMIDFICNGQLIDGRLRLHIAENVRLHIDWRASDYELIARFKAWVKENRKHRSTPDLSARKLRADLKALAALRLFRTDKQKDSTLFAQQGEWTKARKRALRIIASL
jgi:hypothetical protein